MFDSLIYRSLISDRLLGRLKSPSKPFMGTVHTLPSTHTHARECTQTHSHWHIKRNTRVFVCRYCMLTALPRPHRRSVVVVVVDCVRACALRSIAIASTPGGAIGARSSRALAISEWKRPKVLCVRCVCVWWRTRQSQDDDSSDASFFLVRV